MVRTSSAPSLPSAVSTTTCARGAVPNSKLTADFSRASKAASPKGVSLSTSSVEVGAPVRWLPYSMSTDSPVTSKMLLFTEDITLPLALRSHSR